MSILRVAAAACVGAGLTIAATWMRMGPLAMTQQSGAVQTDENTWLEEIHGERQLAWVKKKTLVRQQFLKGQSLRTSRS